MFKRIAYLCLAFLMLMTILAGPVMTTAYAAEEEQENQWTLVRFSWEEETPNHNTWKHMEYALVGSGNGEAAFEELSPYYTVYRYRFMNMINQLKNQAIKQSENVTLVEINAAPTEVSIKTTVETEDDGDVSFTSVVFNDTEVANVEGDTAFVVVSWAMDEDAAKPEGENDLYLYHRDGCMDGNGAERELCPYCGLITVHEVLFCGHRSCIRAKHEVAGCGYYGHLACRGFHNRAECGTYGHYVCVGDHEEAECGIKKHYNCDGEDHTACPGCSVRRCSTTYVAANHAVAPCGHYICSSGYTAAEHEKLACGHYECMENFDATEHAAAACGTHYICAAGYDAADHAVASCGHRFCAAGTHGVVEPCGHFACAEGTHGGVQPCGHFPCKDGLTHGGVQPCGHFPCAANGPHGGVQPCGHFPCADNGPHGAALPCGHFPCASGNHTTCGTCGKYLCNGEDHSACTAP